MWDGVDNDSDGDVDCDDADCIPEQVCGGTGGGGEICMTVRIMMVMEMPTVMTLIVSQHQRTGGASGAPMGSMMMVMAGIVR